MTLKITLWGWRGTESGVAGRRENQYSGTITKRERVVFSGNLLSPPAQRAHPLSTFTVRSRFNIPFLYAIPIPVLNLNGINPIM